MSLLKLHLLDGLQQTVGELLLTIISCPSIIILENNFNRINVVVVTLTTDIIFLLFTRMTFWA
jgi:ABC-type uncharacterized transport system ATPase subunit